MQSLLGKRVAKELHVLRYIPERKVYEMRVEWESDASPSTFFLSEVFLYPYSLRPQSNQLKLDLPARCVKELPSPTNNNVSPGIKINTIENTNHPLLPCKSKYKAKTSHEFLLDYDSLVEPAVMKQSMRVKKSEIVVHRPNKADKKKRKA
jgi:hypothetical protein